MKTLLTSTALLLGLSVAAAAQTATDTPVMPATPEAPAMQPETSATPMPGATAEVPAETAPAAGQMTTLATLTGEELIGTRVQGAQGEDVGEVSDVTLDASGAVASVVIDVGGFLGIGEKPVALGADDVTVTPDADGKGHVLKVSMTEDQLKALPEHQG